MQQNLLIKKGWILVLFLLYGSMVNAMAQGIAIKGKVTDASGAGLPGASVVLKGTSIASATDVDGNFTLNLPSGTGTLVVSYIGFVPKEVGINNQTTINIVLETDAKSLDEVVVVGYGTQRKSDITGSVAVVDVADMKKVSTNDVGAMLQGRVSGVSVNTDGQPGAFPQVRIRGIGTFGNSDPLYVIDGVPVSTVPREFSPNDIESMQVLKDASAGAIYGSRAANGVVIITTKKGRKDTPLQVGYSGYYGIDQVWQRMPVTNRANYQILNNESRLNAGKALAPANDPSHPSFIDDVNTDWQEEGLKTGNRQNHNVSLSGGGANNTYNVSLDYFGNKGTYVGNGPSYDRYTARVNTTLEKGIFKVGQAFNYTKSNENGLVTGDGVLAGGRPPLINDLVFAIPTMALYDPNNEGGFGGTLSEREDAISLNGIGYNSLIRNTTDVDRLFASIFGEVEIIKGLKYRLNLGYDATNIRDYNFIPEFNLGYFFQNNIARLNDNSRRLQTLLVENTLNYEKVIGQHSLAVLVGQMYQKDDGVYRQGYAEGFVKPYLPVLFNGATSTASGTEDSHVLASYLGRVNYSFADKYLVTATLRRDGSSRFSPANRFGYFPSLALGWKLINEEFINLPEDIFTDLKIRASWGKLGNENIGNYLYYPLINSNVVYTFNNGQRVLGGLQTNVYDESIKWEEKSTTNIGFDAVLFNGAVDLSAEYYNSKSEDVLVNIPIPASVGSVNAAPVTNAGTLRNSGVEISAGYNKLAGDFRYGISANFTTLHNEVLDLGLNVTERYGVGSITEVGGEVGRHYGWLADGIFQSQEEIANHAFQKDGTSPGDIKFRDISGPEGTPDGIVDTYDRTYLGSGIPKFTYGLNFNASYKNFDFTLFMSGKGKYLINSRLYRSLMHTAGDDNWHEDILDRWTTVNTDTDIPRLIHSDPNENGRDSNREGWLQDGTHLRINTISLGYNFKEGLIKGLASARVYVTAQNLYTFQKYKGYNPDFTAGVFEPGFDNGSFPRPRTLMLGVQIGF
ncbi:SusC/RagA family TonB-linked outer membrane protein [Rufibacter sediminis]|uniref:TonB-dependent receptor n=1 Tax=Rufibacter sediminis TaxID=2762756 RepID=A0ABR6VXB3_9BACT|nr:TonB-dependent receptor [Rufibacter sediminis]MBC3541784.1 TonB-dependent receptor [Rufibacter sediminis]